MAQDYADAGHRPHAVHTGEEPRTPIHRGPYALSVTLDAWGPQENIFTTIYDALQANWGDAPSRTIDRSCLVREDVMFHEWEHKTGWCRLSLGERAYVLSCFAGRTLPQILELIGFSFCIDGLCRPATHQIVRSRIGAGFMQHGGRDNDWRHRGWTMPETMHRACQADEMRDLDYKELDASGLALEHCVSDWVPIQRYLRDVSAGDASASNRGLREAIEMHLDDGKRLYAALVDAGIPWQDARRVLTMGTQTYIHADYSWPALKSVLANRLEFVMDWEINCVAQLMVRELRMKTPEVIWRHLVSASDAARKATRAGLESWPPDGKWPVEDRHKDLPRTHTPLQSPFWVLHPDSLSGGDIVWVATNGEYPHDALHAEAVKAVGASE